MSPKQCHADEYLTRDSQETKQEAGWVASAAVPGINTPCQPTGVSWRDPQEVAWLQGSVSCSMDSVSDVVS